MTKNKYYLHLINGVVVGYHSNEIDKDVLPKGEKFLPIETDTPASYLNLDEKQIYLDPLPEVSHDLTDRNTLSYRRQELKRLFYEINFTVAIKEDAKDLQLLYDTKLHEYNDLKAK